MNALTRIGRKRRGRQTQPEQLTPFAVDGCECLVDGPFALLRLTGTGVNPPASLATDGDHPQSFEPLPQPDAGESAGVWRAAFALPAELAQPGARLWLLDGGEFVTDLRVPAPAEPKSEPVTDEPVAEAAEPVVRPKAAQQKAKPAPEPIAEGDDPRARKLVEAWSEAAHLREQLSDRELELSKALQELLAARTDVDPLRERVDVLMDDLDAVRGELELAHKQGREARLRATEKAAELDAARAELASVAPRLTEALEATERAEREAASMREQVERLESELSGARQQVETAATDAAERQRAAEELETELTKLKEQPKSRRRGFGRRDDDRALGEVRTQLEARIAEQQERIEQLEQEAASFAERRDEAVAASLRERVAELEEELRQHVATGGDLRALIASERELVAGARGEVRDLKEQLAAASAKRVAAVAPPAPVASEAPVAGPPGGSDDAPARAAVEPPPWSALDDELLARIEKAKALTG